MVERNDAILDALIALCKAGKEIHEAAQAYVDAQKLPASQYPIILQMFKEQSVHYPSFDVNQKILTQKFILDLQSDQYYLYNEKLKRLTEVKKSSLQTLFNAKAFQKIQDTRLKLVYMGYNPNTPILFYEKFENTYINKYRPSEWQFPYVYESQVVPKVALPERYDKFFRHMCDNEDLSYRFLLSFLGATVQPGHIPQTYLTLLGKPGVGKNTLIDVMAEVLGTENTIIFNDGNLKDVRFNSEFKEKKLIMFDEVLVRDTVDERFLKGFVNPTISIEEKGKDKKVYDNYASIVLAANSLASIRVSNDDRRYSFLDLPNVTLKDFHKVNHADMSFEYYRKTHLLEPSAIQQLGEYLLNYKVDYDLIDWPPETKAKKRQKEEGLLDWELAIFDMVAPLNHGRTLTMDQANSQLEEHVKIKNRPSIARWRTLSQLKPGYFEVVRDRDGKNSTRPTVVKFAELSKQPKEKVGKDEN